MKPSNRRFWLAIVCGLTAFMGLWTPSTVVAQTQTYPCETIVQYGTGTSTNGAKLRSGARDSLFQGTDATFANPPNANVLTDPPATWIANSASDDSQWIGPSTSIVDDIAGISVYRLLIVAPCVGATLTGRYAASDRGAIRLNGAPVAFPTSPTGWTTWTPFSFNNLLSGLNRLEFYVTNSTPAVGGRPGPTGLRVEAMVKATCCPCIELNCPSDIYLTTCSNGAPARFSVTGTNRCFTNLTINCSLASSTGNPVTSGYVFPVGTHTVICTASDTAGHRTNCAFRVTVTRDAQPPQIRCPQDIIYPCSVSGTNVYFNVTVTDDTDPSPVVSCVPPSGSFFPTGTNNVICEARDSCGRVSRCSFSVILAPNGFTKTLQAGVADDFQLNDFEPADAGPCLGSSGYWTAMPFDTYFPGRHLAHSFQGLPDNLSAARLILHMKPRLTTSQDDVLRIGLQNCGGAGVWAFSLPVASLPGAGGVWTTNPPTTFTLDLAALPGGVNLVAALNASHRLELAVGTETLVDYARLEVSYCGAQSTLSGVPYALNNVRSIHQGEGISWHTVNSNGPPPTIALDIGQADGFRLNLPPPDVFTLCNRIQWHEGQIMTWPTGAGTEATVGLLEAGTNAFLRTLIVLDQPSNLVGKAVEVWKDGKRVSRYFQTGNGASYVTVRESACLSSMGFTKGYFFANFTQPEDIELLGTGSHVSGDFGPVINGTSVRLYFVVTRDWSTQKYPRITLFTHDLSIGSISLWRDNTWIEPFGPQQISISDVAVSQALVDSPSYRFGNCILATPGWMIELTSPVPDFCELYYPGADLCYGGYLNVEMTGSSPLAGSFGGLRLTPSTALIPTGLPMSDACRIDNTVGNASLKNVEIALTAGSPVTLNNITNIESLHWPTKISGNAGPQQFVVDLPPATMVSVNGQTYSASRVTFHSGPITLVQDYQVCTEIVGGIHGLSVKSMIAPPPNDPASSPDCLTLTCPTNIIVSSTNAGGNVVTFNATGATRCGRSVVVTCEPPSGSVFPPGDTVVQCTAIDSQGNQEQCEFLVTVLPTWPLAVTRLDRNQVEFRWSGSAVLESADVLGVRAVWRPVIGKPISSGTESRLVLPIEGRQRYFRTVPLLLAP